MLEYYNQGPTEQWIEQLYKQNGILTSRDLSIQNLTKVFSIFLFPTHGPTKGSEQDGIRIILVTKGLDKFQFKQRFFHELCHILRHEGNEFMMPKTWREFLEMDAKRFTNLAMMPFFMLKELEVHEWHPVHLATIFDVSYEYACDRLNYIQNRIQANYLEELDKIKFFTVKKEQTFLHS
ncbi:ImmA/IrrE family metallo-endopeptidase [Aneurinibacillus aneurinilyticus]|uniref:ImmA/IrrE family metallo-endopeptidase n=1 Tax=Aneurinibacillus aneurinilyticus TaxID=1391 RepID=UPI002E1EEC9F|nr:ImmA/IrrE family metallo-endopeptidase [Aneurinibacillus aneurinilyticus]